ncbi:restriction endonuclease subunit M [Planctomycetales bacterium]|nr:restriction endonuclease subunit M [Planctomycetales bacterium]
MPNQLFYGDNLEVLQKHIGNETVDLCYVDPPFNSKRNYNQIYNNVGKDDIAQSQAFVDTWVWGESAEEQLDLLRTDPRYTNKLVKTILGFEQILGKGGMLSYLVNMALRFAEIWRVLKPTGSFFVHCDPTVAHYLKIVLDSIFCDRNGDIINEIVWCYETGGRSNNFFPRKHDTIFFYAKNINARVFYDEAVRLARDTSTMHEPILKDESGKEYQRNVKNGKEYRYYLDKGVLPNDYWVDIQALNPSAKERLGYPTQKPLALLERIIKASSNEGDVVLDAFCGCGTTVDAAQSLNRRWIGIDITYNAVALILKRLKDRYGNEIKQQIQLSGLPKDLEAARALANRKDDRLRKEFEKWSILTYTDNHAKINDKKGADKGIDGIAYLLGNGTVLFSVKSGKVSVNDVRTLQAVVEREKATSGILLTLQEPTKNMLQEASAAGYLPNLPGLTFSKKAQKLQIVTIQEIMDGARLTLPLPDAVVKSAEEHKKKQEQTLL